MVAPVEARVRLDLCLALPPPSCAQTDEAEGEERERGGFWDGTSGLATHNQILPI